ncbi:hypothetical protein K456DRAFT_87505 [Colletotrichum gloeosporioides 23]|nr:hypothetical protein K456DRAFT_87505 [Colletotrichum gloeosporioides 23]
MVAHLLTDLPDCCWQSGSGHGVTYLILRLRCSSRELLSEANSPLRCYCRALPSTLFTFTSFMTLSGCRPTMPSHAPGRGREINRTALGLCTPPFGKTPKKKKDFRWAAGSHTALSCCDVYLNGTLSLDSCWTRTPKQPWLLKPIHPHSSRPFSEIKCLAIWIPFSAWSRDLWRTAPFPSQGLGSLNLAMMLAGWLRIWHGGIFPMYESCVGLAVGERSRVVFSLCCKDPAYPSSHSPRSDCFGFGRPPIE